MGSKDIDKESFKSMFPNLSKEIKCSTSSIALKVQLDQTEKVSKGKFDGYAPEILDFLRRCDNDQQAEEIISHIERKKEISQEYAQKIRRQLHEMGVRSFGLKKEEEYYLSQSGF